MRVQQIFVGPGPCPGAEGKRLLGRRNNLSHCDAPAESYTRHFLCHQTVLQRSRRARILHLGSKNSYALFGAKQLLGGLGGLNEDEALSSHQNWHRLVLPQVIQGVDLLRWILLTRLPL